MGSLALIVGAVFNHDESGLFTTDNRAGRPRGWQAGSASAWCGESFWKTVPTAAGGRRGPPYFSRQFSQMKNRRPRLMLCVLLHLTPDAYMKLHEVKKRTAEPQNIESR